MNSLPPEILQVILNNYKIEELTNWKLVNKSWKDVIENIVKNRIKKYNINISEAFHVFPPKSLSIFLITLMEEFKKRKYKCYIILYSIPLQKVLTR